MLQNEIHKKQTTLKFDIKKLELQKTPHFNILKNANY